MQINIRMRWCEIEIGYCFQNIDRSKIQLLHEFCSRVIKERLEGVDLSEIGEEDLDRITDECFDDITNGPWKGHWYIRK